jgi:hypothetical protein
LLFPEKAYLQVSISGILYDAKFVIFSIVDEDGLGVVIDPTSRASAPRPIAMQSNWIRAYFMLA